MALLQNKGNWSAFRLGGRSGTSGTETKNHGSRAEHRTKEPSHPQTSVIDREEAIIDEDEAKDEVGGRR